MCFDSAEENGLSPLSPSSATLPGAVANAISVPAPAVETTPFRPASCAASSPHDARLHLAAAPEDFKALGIGKDIEVREDGEWVLSDYKTGRTPSQERALGSFFGLQFYALVCWRAFGKMPRELRLLQLGVPEVLTLQPTQQMLEGVERQMDALGQAIQRARARDDWRPHPSALCTRCHHKAICPAWPAETTALPA